MKSKIEKIINSKTAGELNRFYNSVWYIACLAAACIMSYFTGLTALGITLICVLVIPSLIVCKNSFVIMPALLLCIFCVTPDTATVGYFTSVTNISVFCVLAVFVAAAFVFNIVYYGKWRQVFKRAYLTVSLCLATGALVVGGIGAPSFSLIGVGMSIAIGFSMFVPYSFFINCGEYNGRKTVEYFACTLMAVALTIFMAVVKQYYIHGLSLSYHPKSDIIFGYAISNTAAALVVLAIPMTFYLAVVYKHGYLFLLGVILEIVTIALTYSRAAFLVAAVGTIIVSIAICFKKKNGRLGYYIVFGMCVVGALALLIAYRHKFVELVVTAFSGTGSGRTDLWSNGWNAYKEYPAFGLGLWYLPPINDWYFSFHCTPLTYLYCAGIFGIAAYAYHRYKTVRLVFSAKLNKERVFVALTMLAMLCNALLDIAMTSPLHLLYYAAMLALIEHDVRAAKKRPERIEYAKCGALYDDVKTQNRNILDS